MIVVTLHTTATNADVLGGSDLDSIPGDGQMDVYGASSQADGTLSIRGPGNENIITGQTLQLRTNGEPNMEDDLPFSFLVKQGGQYRIDYTEVTAATAVFLVVYRSVQELVGG